MPAQTRTKFRAFRVKDLMVNVLPGVSGGGTSYPTDEGTISPFPTTITPVIMSAVVARKIQVFQKFALQAEQLDLEVVDRFAMDIGRAVVGSAFRCTQESATCKANPRISPIATLGLDRGLGFDDIVELRADLELAIAKIAEVEDDNLAQARRQAGELIPRLEGALEELKGPPKKR